MDIKLHIANMSYIMMFETCHVMSDILRINMDKPTCGIHQPFVGRIFLGFPQPVLATCKPWRSHRCPAPP